MPAAQGAERACGVVENSNGLVHQLQFTQWWLLPQCWRSFRHQQEVKNHLTPPVAVMVRGCRPSNIVLRCCEMTRVHSRVICWSMKRSRRDAQPWCICRACWVSISTSVTHRASTTAATGAHPRLATCGLRVQLATCAVV